MNHRLALLALTACASAEPSGVGSGAPADAPAARIDVPTAVIDAAPTPDAAPIVGTCATTVTCQTAQALGTVSGDTGAGSLGADGYQAAWFRVRVTEDYSDLPGLALRVASKLTPPASGGFDTFVYVNAATDAVECSTTIGTTTTNGNVKEVRAEWGEGFVPNGGDDSRDVTIEVRPATATSCSTNQTWHLDIEGNWL